MRFGRFVVLGLLLATTSCSKAMRVCRKLESTEMVSDCAPRTSKYGGAKSVGFTVTKGREGKVWVFADVQSYNEATKYSFDQPSSRFLNGESLIEVVIYGEVSSEEEEKIQTVVNAL